MTKIKDAELEALERQEREAEEQHAARIKEIAAKKAAHLKALDAKYREAELEGFRAALDRLREAMGSKFITDVQRAQVRRLGEAKADKPAKTRGRTDTPLTEKLLAGLPKSFATDAVLMFRRPGTSDKWKGGTEGVAQRKAQEHFEEWFTSHGAAFWSSRAGQAQREAAQASGNHPLQDFLTRYPVASFAAAFSAEQRSKNKK